MVKVVLVLPCREDGGERRNTKTLQQAANSGQTADGVEVCEFRDSHDCDFFGASVDGESRAELGFVAVVWGGQRASKVGGGESGLN